MLPTIYDILEVLAQPHSGNRFKHCDGTTENASIYEDGEAYYCHKCSSAGNALTLLESWGVEGQDVDNLLGERFPMFNRLDTRHQPDPLKKALTHFTNLANAMLLTSEDPRIVQIREWMLIKWGLTREDIQRFRIGLSISPMIQWLPQETLDAMNTIGMFDHGTFRLNRYLIFPEYKRGYVDYFQGRNLDPNCDKHHRHFKVSHFAATAFGYYDSKKVIKRSKEVLPLVVVEGICDYYTMAKLGFPCVSVTGAGAKQTQVVAKILDLHKSCSGTIVEFDQDAKPDDEEKKNSGREQAIVMASLLCDNGIDSIPTFTSAHTFLEVLPPEIEAMEKLDIGQLGALLTVENLRNLYVGKYRNLLGIDSSGAVMREPSSFLRMEIQKAHSPEAMERVYRWVSNQAESMQPQYYGLLTAQFSHKTADIKKYLKKYGAKCADDVLVVEDDEFMPYKNPSHDYQPVPAEKAMFCTKSGFYRGKVLVDPDTQEYETLLLLCVIVTKQQEISPGEYKVTLHSKEVYTAEQAAQLGKSFPTRDMRYLANTLWWEPSGGVSAKDPFCLKQVGSNFEKALAELNAQELYVDVYNYFRDRVIFSDPRYIHIAVLYVFMSYCFRLFSAVPYLHIKGPKNSGKSQLLKCFGALCFKANVSVADTAATLFRSIDQHCPTLCLDEQEFNKISKDKSDTSDKDQDKYQILNAGYADGLYVSRNEVDPKLKRMEREYYDVYGPKIFGGISNFYGTLESRCITVKTRSAHMEEQERLKVTDKFEDHEEAKSIQNRLMVWSLSQAMQLNINRLTVLGDRNFTRRAGNRNTQLFSPLLTVLRTLGDPMGFEDNFLEYIKQHQSEQSQVTAASFGYELLRVLRKTHTLLQDPKLHKLYGVYSWSPSGMKALYKPYINLVKQQLLDVYQGAPEHEVSLNRIRSSLERDSVARRTSCRSQQVLRQFRDQHRPTVGANGDYYEAVNIDVSLAEQILKSNEGAFNDAIQSRDEELGSIVDHDGDDIA
jgi:hypothetical protein